MNGIEGIEIVLVSIGVGWMAGWLSKICAMTKRDENELLRKAVKYGFRVDGKRYVCKLTEDDYENH